MATAIKVKLGWFAEKKQVVRFNAEGEGVALANAYITKAALKKLGDPKAITITIEAA